MTVEQLYYAHLQQRGMSEDKMGPVQRIEVKRAFYSGVSMILLYNTTEMCKMPTDQAARKIVDMTKECTEFWQNEKLRDAIDGK